MGMRGWMPTCENPASSSPNGSANGPCRFLASFKPRITLYPRSMVQGLRTIVYPVGNLIKAKAWYSGALGQEPYFDEPFYVGFNVGGFESGPDPYGPVAGQCAPVSYWGAPDAAAAYTRLLALGAQPTKPCTTWGRHFAGHRAVPVR